MGKIILIGGAPAVGKSYLAQQLSLKLGIPKISTNDIRILIHSARKKTAKDAPLPLFDSEGQPPQATLRKVTPQELLVQHRKESEDVWHDVLLFIKVNDLWESYIIEGTSILPEFIARDLKHNKNIRPLFLLDRNQERITNVAKMKMVWEHNNEYADKAKMLNVEWVLYFNNWLRKELTKYNFPKIELSEESMSINNILKVID